MTKGLDKPPVNFGYLMSISNELLSILEPFSQNKRITLKSKDYNNIKDIRKFLDYAARGTRNWEKMPENLFNYDLSFFATPTSAANVSLETIGCYLGYVKDFKELRNKLRNYSDILGKFQNQKEVSKKEINETIRFLDGLAKISEEEVEEAIWGVKPLRKTLFPRQLFDYIRPQIS